MFSLILALAVLLAGSLITALPAAFMSAVSLTYILMVLMVRLSGETDGGRQRDGKV